VSSTTQQEQEEGEKQIAEFLDNFAKLPLRTAPSPAAAIQMVQTLRRKLEEKKNPYVLKLIEEAARKPQK
jgi:hypothetical protein